MASRDIGEAAERAKRKKELMEQPVPMRPYAPENAHMSKAEFIAKRRHEKEEELAVQAFKKKFRLEKAEQDKLEKAEQDKKGQEKPKEKTHGEEKAVVKKGRPKKIED